MHDTVGARTVVRRAAAAGIVLLTNDGALPLDGVGHIALIGPNASGGATWCGNYSYPNHVSYRFPAEGSGVDLPGLADALGAAFAAGERRGPAPRVPHIEVVPGCDHVERDRSGFLTAVAAARAADVAIVVVGDRVGHFNQGTVGEGTDRSSLELPGVQAALVTEVCTTGTPVVVVHVGGRAPDLGSIVDDAAAVVMAWLPGEAGTAAVADVLTGRVNPSGRLPISVDAPAGTQPAPYRRPELAARPYVDGSGAARFPFGHGLSYTTFEYADLRVAPTATVDGALVVSCSVANTGGRSGHEVVQLYVRDEVASVVRPERELRAFTRVALAAGERVRVTFRVPTDVLAFCDASGDQVVEPGTHRVFLGGSSSGAVDAGVCELTGDRRVVVPPRRLECPATVERLAPLGPPTPPPLAPIVGRRDVAGHAVVPGAPGGAFAEWVGAR